MTASVSYAGSKMTHLGIPDTNLNQLTVDQLAQGSALLRRVPNQYFGLIPRSSSLGDPTIPLAQLLKPFPESTTVSLYRNNVGNSIIMRSRPGSSGGCLAASRTSSATHDRSCRTTLRQCSTHRC